MGLATAGRVLTTLALALPLAACGETRQPAPDDPGASATSTPGTEPGSGQPSPSGSESTPPSEALKKVRVVGQVTSEGDCVVVTDDNQITWTLTGPGTTSLTVGQRVAASGTPDLRATGCGGPLVVVRSLRVLG